VAPVRVTCLRAYGSVCPSSGEFTSPRGGIKPPNINLTHRCF